MAERRGIYIINDGGGIVTNNGAVYPGNQSGKISRVMLGTMINAYLDSEGRWEDAEACMTAAANSVGLEVEG